jgi:single-strand DNA-binding protein
MFGDLNSVSLIGNITKDIDVRYTPNGKAVANFGLATNRSYKLPDASEWKDEVTFHNIVLFGNSVEMFAQRAHKGTRVYINGHIQTRNWQDKEGKTNYKTEVVVDKILLLDRYERGAGSTLPAVGTPKGDASYSEDIGDAAMEEMPTAAKKSKSKDADVIDPDDLPF